MTPYLTELRDKSAEEYCQLPHPYDVMIYKSGFDKAHDTLMPVLLEMYRALDRARDVIEFAYMNSPDIPKEITEVREALEKAARLLGQG
jgi:hypothetical protein